MYCSCMWVGRYIISSPCVGVCTLENEVCIGCFRERSEITNWQKMTLNEKKDALIDIEERRKKFVKYEQH